MKKTLIALTVSMLADTFPSDLKITRASVGQVRQHPSLRYGKSGVAAARRKAKRRKTKK